MTPERTGDRLDRLVWLEDGHDYTLKIFHAERHTTGSNFKIDTTIRFKVVQPPAASAQLKSAVLLAGLSAPGETVVEEGEATRDHTERMLRHFGADVAVAPNGAHGKRITLTGQKKMPAWTCVLSNAWCFRRAWRRAFRRASRSNCRRVTRPRCGRAAAWL